MWRVLIYSLIAVGTLLLIWDFRQMVKSRNLQPEHSNAMSLIIPSQAVLTGASAQLSFDRNLHTLCES